MYEYAVTVVSVHDGDTINVDLDFGFWTWLRNRGLRLDGIACPELGTLKDPIPAGQTATLHLMELLGGRHLFAAERTPAPFGRFGDYLVHPGMTIPLVVKTRLSQRSDLEKYGRVLADVRHLDGRSINMQMVLDGQAVLDS